MCVRGGAGAGPGAGWGQRGAEPHPLVPPQWLNEEKIVQRLIEQIHPSKDDNVSAAARELRPRAPLNE